jgi:glycosyltransferase involved in cell wall biosynthesis
LNPKRILYIHHSSSWGGAAINLIENIKALDKDQYLPHVLLLKDSFVADKLKENNIAFSIAKSAFYKRVYTYFTHSEADYVLYYQAYKFIKLSISWLLSHYYFAKRELDCFSYDIIQVNSSVLTDWLKPGKRKGFVVLHVQEPFRKGKFDFLYLFFRKQMRLYSDRIIAISKDNARRINLPQKTTVVYNFLKVPHLSVNNESYYSKTFLYLGGTSPIKGFYTLVDCLKYLDTDVKVLFGGKLSTDMISGNYVKKLLYYIFSNHRKRLKAISTIKNSSNTEIIGLVSNVSELINNSCCVISPFSKPHFSRPVIEGHLHQKMAIGSNVEGMSEIIEQDKTGMLIPKDCPKELAVAINYVAKHPHEAKRMGINGFQIAVQKFTESNTAQMQKVYRNLH